MTNNYTLFLLNNELVRLLDARDVLNSVGDSSEAVNTKIKNIENSIKTLEESRGLIVTDSEGGKMIINENGVTFSGKLTVTPATSTTNVDMNKYKWDSTDESDESTSFIVNFIDLAMKELGLSVEEVKQGKRDESQVDKFAKRIADSLKRQQGLR